MAPDRKRNVGDAIGTGRVEEFGRRFSVLHQPSEGRQRARSICDVVVLPGPA